MTRTLPVLLPFATCRGFVPGLSLGALVPVGLSEPVRPGAGVSCRPLPEATPAPGQAERYCQPPYINGNNKLCRSMLVARKALL